MIENCLQHFGVYLEQCKNVHLVNAFKLKNIHETVGVKNYICLLCCVYLPKRDFGLCELIPGNRNRSSYPLVGLDSLYSGMPANDRMTIVPTITNPSIQFSLIALMQ